MTTQAIIKALKRTEKVLSKERDSLRDIENEASDLGHTADTALESLRQCIDSLSGLV